MTIIILDIIFNLGIFFALGFIGFFILNKLKVPAPAILGSMIFLGIANFIGIRITLPSMLSPILTIVLGIILGLRFNIKIKGLVKIALLVSAWLAALTLFTAWILAILGLDRATALFSASPGGLTEMVIMTMSFNGDAFVVVLLQTSRFLLTLLVIPFVVQFADKKIIRNETAAVVSSEEKSLPSGSSSSSGDGKVESLKKIDWLALITFGLLSAWLFSMLNIPAPYMIGPMLATGVYAKFRNLNINVNNKLQIFIQIGIGGMVGLSIARESILNLPSYIIPIIALNIIIFGGCGILALILYKLTGWDLLTCMIAVAPGGMASMILLAMEMKADYKIVAVFQVLRLFLVLLLTPLAGKLLL